MEEQEILEEEVKTEKKGHKKAKRSVIAIALAALIAVGGSFIKTSPHNIEGSLTDFVNNNKETTLFDEILDLDETIGIKNVETGEIEKVQVEDAIKILEEKASIDEKIADLKIKNDDLNELPEESKKATLKFLNENGIDAIIELYNDKNNTKIDKARIAQQLLYIKESNAEWLKENGAPVSISILTRVLSAGSIDAYGTFTPEEYTVCNFDSKIDDHIKEITLVDPVSGEKDKIVLLPIVAEEYYKAYKELQFITNKKEIKEDEVLEIVNDTLNLSKRCINKQLDQDGIITYTKKVKKTEKQTEE